MFFIPPMGGALLFALHPVPVEAVVWVSSVKDLLAVFSQKGWLAESCRARSSYRYWLPCLDLNMGRGNDAVAVFQQSVRVFVDPELDPVNNLCLLLGSMKRSGEAVTACQQAIARNVDYGEAYFNLGNAYYAQGRNHEAVNAYKNVLERDSSHARAVFNAGGVSGAYVNLSRVLLQKGENDEAAQMYQQAKSLGVSDPMLEGVFFPSSILQQP